MSPGTELVAEGETINKVSLHYADEGEGRRLGNSGRGCGESSRGDPIVTMGTKEQLTLDPPMGPFLPLP